MVGNSLSYIGYAGGTFEGLGLGVFRFFATVYNQNFYYNNYIGADLVDPLIFLVCNWCNPHFPSGLIHFT